MLEFHELLGLLGVSMSLGAYIALQLRRDFAKTTLYSVLNLVSALLLIFTLSQDWNLSALFSNIV